MPICSRHNVGYEQDGFCPQCAAGVPATQADGCFTALCLQVGQLVSLAGCIGCVWLAVWGLVQLAQGGAGSAMQSGLVRLSGGIIGFFYSAGLWLVFSRTKRNRPWS